MKGKAGDIEVFDDRFSAPIAIPIDNVSTIAFGQQFGIEARIVGPGRGVRPNTGSLVFGSHVFGTGLFVVGHARALVGFSHRAAGIEYRRTTTKCNAAAATTKTCHTS